MVNPIEPGDIPHEIQRDVVAAAIEAAAFALRQGFEDDPAKAAWWRRRPLLRGRS